MCSNFFILCRTNQTAWTPLPVNRSKSVEVLQREAVKISEAIQLPESVQVSPAILPQSRNFIERPDDAAAFRACLSDHRHAAAAAHTCCCKLLCPAQRQRHRATPNTPLGHLNNKKCSLCSTFSNYSGSAKDTWCKKGGERLVYRVGPPFCPDQGFLVEPHRIDQRTDYDSSAALLKLLSSFTALFIIMFQTVLHKITFRKHVIFVNKHLLGICEKL